MGRSQVVSGGHVMILPNYLPKALHCAAAIQVGNYGLGNKG